MSSPTETQDYCQSGCDGAVTEWDGEVCRCCRGRWGHGPEGTCRGQHVEGQTDEHA